MNEIHEFGDPGLGADEHAHDPNSDTETDDDGSLDDIVKPWSLDDFRLDHLSGVLDADSSIDADGGLGRSFDA